MNTNKRWYHVGFYKEDVKKGLIFLAETAQEAVEMFAETRAASGDISSDERYPKVDVTLVEINIGKNYSGSFGIDFVLKITTLN